MHADDTAHRTARLRLLIIALAVVLLAATAVAGWRVPHLRWRAQLVVEKSLGRLAGVPWSHVFAGILPHKVRESLDFEALRVTPEKRGPGPCTVLWRTPVGPLWGREGDRESLEMASKYRLYDEFYLRGDASLRAGDTVIDAGGHLGTFTALALARGARHIIVFEPDPVNASCLRETFSADVGSGRVVVLEEAVWDAPGVLEFERSSDSLTGSVADALQPPAEATSTIAVRATTIDDAIETLKVARIDVIKLNVEGAERNAVRGARRTIQRFRPRIIVNLEHHADDADVIPALVREAAPGYRTAWRGREQAFFY